MSLVTMKKATTIYRVGWILSPRSWTLQIIYQNDDVRRPIRRDEWCDPSPKRAVFTNSSNKGKRRKGQRSMWKREQARTPSKPSYDKTQTWSARVTRGLTSPGSRLRTAPKSRSNSTSLKVTTKRKLHRDNHKQKDFSQGYNQKQKVTPPCRPPKAHSSKRWLEGQRNKRHDKKWNRSCGQVTGYSQYRSKQSKFSSQQQKQPPRRSAAGGTTSGLEKWKHTTKVNKPKKVISAKKRLRATTPPAQSMPEIPLILEQRTVKQVSNIQNAKPVNEQEQSLETELACQQLSKKVGVCKQRVENLSLESEYHWLKDNKVGQLVLYFIGRYLFSLILGVALCIFMTVCEPWVEQVSWTDSFIRFGGRSLRLSVYTHFIFCIIATL